MPDHRPLIFISYRGSDQNWATELVYARMTQAFGVESVFKAGNSIAASERFPAILRRQAASCPVMLVLIGPGWLTAGEPGTRRLEDPDDWVRREISISLEADNHLVPLLIGNHDQVKVPDARELPEDIRPLADCQASRLAPGGGLDLTFPALIDRLAALVPELGEPRAEAASRGDQVPADQRAQQAERGAVTLAATMAAERWDYAREAARQMFAFVDPARCAVLLGQLDQDSAALGSTAAEARDRLRERIAARWEGRLEELLDRHPAMGDQLEVLIAKLHADAAQPGSGQKVYHQRVEATGQGSAFGVQDGNVNYYASPGAASAASPPAAPEHGPGARNEA